MILMLMALGVQLLNAQQKTVSGTVSDENGLPLPADMTKKVWWDINY